MKLTHYISYRYIGVTVLVMLISIPIFYFVIENVLQNNLDEQLEERKSSVVEKLKEMPVEKMVYFQDEITIKKNPKKLIADSIYTQEIYNAKEDETDSFRTLQFPTKVDGTTYNITITESLVEREDLMKNILLMLITILLILTITLLLINTHIREKIWKPFYKTIEELKNFRVDDLQGLNLEKSNINEFSDLNQSLNALSAVNQKVYQSQKEFTENASHELQTPLAILQNNVELFWQTEDISEEQAEILENISGATSRMTRLNKSLLLLSKIENKQFNDIQDVNLNRLAEDFFKNYQEQIKFKNIDLKTQLSRFFIVKIDDSLAEILVNNLLLNALKYAPKDSSVELLFTENSMSISNQSNGNSLDETKLFKRFQRQSKQENSTGLGLEIAHQIAVSFDLKLNYEFKNERHFFHLKQ
ncbi:sensor histidine kinase [Frigoriflavimonas asaccharolytica]|uniref:histidine kinase n=1 Tax=Frigoriflavimonas asaccharolytica TaxID=2735899 RepID=A0A8J8GDN8_9FLAO|nr:HAMP domain-containing sensor histidine kinase [Frigoriflavimonas asaccharolytica]NRS94030.1 signal transduction histidine kinase [Frigoriflavimonas asaccharolytica]